VLARKNGFETVILPEAMRAVNVQPEDGERAIVQMREAGATMATLAELEQEAAAV